jgi:hypothetical protein
MNSSQLFDKMVYLTIKFMFAIQNYIKIDDEQYIKYFSNIDYDIHQHLAKFRIKNQLVYGEKDDNLHYGVS